MCLTHLHQGSEWCLALLYTYGALLNEALCLNLWNLALNHMERLCKTKSSKIAYLEKCLNENKGKPLHLEFRFNPRSIRCSNMRIVDIRMEYKVWFYFYLNQFCCFNWQLLTVIDTLLMMINSTGFYLPPSTHYAKQTSK
jgi:hypothetical protein